MHVQSIVWCTTEACIAMRRILQHHQVAVVLWKPPAVLTMSRSKLADPMKRWRRMPRIASLEESAEEQTMDTMI